MSEREPDVSVIVPVHNTAAKLERCLAALSGQAAGVFYEVIAVNNLSTDGSAAVLARAAGITVLDERRAGAYVARNSGVAQARGRILAFTDSDCVTDPGWIAAIVDAFRDPGVQIVLGCRRPQRETGVIRLIGDYENKKDEMVFAAAEPESYYGFTNNMAVRRATFERYGPFVERPRGADTIFVRRVVAGEGCRVVRYQPAMRIVHLELAESSAYFRKMFTYGRSRQLYRAVVRTRPLTFDQRVRIFRATIRDGGHGWIQAGALALALVGGMAAWSLGSAAGRLAPAGR